MLGKGSVKSQVRRITKLVWWILRIAQAVFSFLEDLQLELADVQLGLQVGGSVSQRYSPQQLRHKRSMAAPNPEAADGTALSRHPWEGLCDICWILN